MAKRQGYKSIGDEYIFVQQLSPVDPNQAAIGFNDTNPTEFNIAVDGTGIAGDLLPIAGQIRIDGSANGDITFAPNGEGSTINTNGGVYSYTIDTDPLNAIAPSFVGQEDSNVNGGGGIIMLRKTRSNAAVQAGDTIGQVIFRGFNGTDFNTSAKIRSLAVGPIGTFVKGTLSLETNNGTAALDIPRMIINEKGNVTINAADSGSDLTLGSTYGHNVGATQAFMVIDNTGQVGTSSDGTVKTTTYSTPGSYSWNKDPRSKWIKVLGWSGGQGGGSGHKGSSTAAGGGGGGAPGNGFDLAGPAGMFNNSETVVVGAGGAGGAAQTTNATDGNDGSRGSRSSFGVITNILGTSSANKGTTTSSGFPPSGTWFTTFPGYNPATTTGGSLGGQGVAGSATQQYNFIYIGFYGTGGGGAGGADNTTARSGAGGAGIKDIASNNLAIGGTAGIPASPDGGPGQDILLSGIGSGAIIGGMGGGGGAGASSAGGGNVAGKGGKGGLGGGGGGGGGGGIDSQADSGAGGDGGDGYVVIYEYF